MSDYRVVDRDRRDVLGEGPLWSARRQALFWVDIKGQRLNRLPLVGGSHGPVDSWALPEMLGWVIERRDSPSLVAGFETGLAFLDLDPFTIRRLFNPEADTPANRLNDAKTDARGRIYFGSMEREGRGAAGSLWRLDPDLGVSRLDTGYGVANGPTFSLDQRTLFHTDSVRGVIYAFDLDDDGAATNKRPFITFRDDWGSPDGMTTDAQGCLWVAHWDGARISRFTPQGELDRVIPLPASRITSCTFAGERLDRMFVTSAAEGREDEPLAGALFEVDPGVSGLPAWPFGG